MTGYSDRADRLAEAVVRVRDERDALRAERDTMRRELTTYRLFRHGLEEPS